jgi:hypothetical protein
LIQVTSRARKSAFLKSIIFFNSNSSINKAIKKIIESTLKIREVQEIIAIIVVRMIVTLAHYFKRNISSTSLLEKEK